MVGVTCFLITCVIVRVFFSVGDAKSLINFIFTNFVKFFFFSKSF